MAGGTLQYPDDFNTPTFPAGPYIASARALGIGVMVVFFLVIVSCGLLLWVQRSARVHPFLVSVNEITGQWDIVGHQHDSAGEMTTTQSLQESVIGNFVRDWFRITSNKTANDALWGKCERSKDCDLDSKTNVDMGRCSLYCISSEEVFDNFLANVVPGYTVRADGGETWEFDMSSLQVSPIGPFSSAGGSWQIRGMIYSNATEPISILGYVRVENKIDMYPQTMGYHVTEFYAYKMN